VHEIGVVVWAVVVIAGVVSSIVQSARKRAALNGTPGTASPASAERLAEMRRLAQTIAVRVDPAGKVVSPVRPAGTAPRQPGAPRPIASNVAAPVVSAPDLSAPAATSPSQAPGWPTGTQRPAHRAIERLYRNRHALADAIVAAEVLGKPLALRNE
jgi:hypothetical protein